MPTEPSPVTLSEVVRRAVAVVDPDDNDAVVGAYEQAFEDADEPIRGIQDLESRIADVVADIDPAGNNGSIQMAGAMTIYLGYRRDEVDEEPFKLLRLAAEAEWQGRPPESVTEWLADRGIDL